MMTRKLKLAAKKVAKRTLSPRAWQRDRGLGNAGTHPDFVANRACRVGGQRSKPWSARKTLERAAKADDRAARSAAQGRAFVALMDNYTAEGYEEW